MQGAAAELVFAVVRYRNWSIGVLAAAALASAVAAWAHDWFIYYAGFAIDLQVARLVIMGVSAIAFAAFGSRMLERALRRAGVLEGSGG
jgi:energy-coupling factor transport system substrate-specific component